MQAQKPSWLKRFLPYVVFGAVCLGFALDLSRFHHIPHGYENVAMDLTLYGHFHASMNYDSLLFLRNADQPGKLLEPTSILQSRPGLVLLVAGMEKLLSPFRSAIMPLFRASGGGIPKNDFIPYFLYLLVNFLLVFLTFFTYLRSVPRKSGFGLAGLTLVGCLFIFNDNVKTFLFSSGTSLFNLAVPLVCLYAFQQVKDRALFDTSGLFLLAFLVGLGMTAYGTFILFLPSVLIALIWVQVRDKERFRLRTVIRFALVLALTLLPSFAWVVYVRAVTGSFYSHEITDMKQFVWILPLLRSNPLLALRDLALNFLVLVRYTAAQAVVLPLILVAATLVTIDRQHGLADRLTHWKQFPLGALIVSLLFLLFFTINGEALLRTAFPAVPPLIAGTGVVAMGMLEDAARPRRWLGLGLVALLVLWQGWATLTKIGPFD